MNKIRSYIGFAIKSNSILMGQSKIKHYNKQIDLIVLSNDATDNLKNLAKNVAIKKQCNTIILNCKLEDLINTSNIKIIAITNLDLANGILNEFLNVIKGELY